MKNLAFPKKILLLVAVSGLAMVGISLMKNAMELEDAEQAYYSQWWRWGYDDQPPLYTWLQLAVHKVLAVSKISFSILRAIIFSCILLALYQFARKFLKSRPEAMGTVLILAAIPTFIDFTFRRLSHTALLCLIVVLTYYMVYKLIYKKSFLNYVLFGFVISIGLMTKYNYALVLLAFGVAAFFNQEIRHILLDRKILLTFAIVGLLLSPHLVWLFADTGFATELRNSINGKTDSGFNQGIPIVTSVLTFVSGFLKLAGPLLIFGVVFFFSKKLDLKTKAVPEKWLSKLLVSQLTVLILVFVVMGVQKVEARWLLPLLLPFVVLLPKYMKSAFLHKFNHIGFFVFLAVLFFQVLRTPIEKIMGIPSSVHYGFEELAGKLQTDFSDKNWFLPDVTYAGNIRLLNQEREVFALDDFSLPPGKTKGSNQVFVVKSKGATPHQGILRDSIIDFGKDKETLFFYTATD